MRKRAGIILLASFLVFAGCQAIFTYSPLTGLQRSPSDMTPAQRLTYAQDALASGDPSAMQKAYDALKSDPSSTAQYTTAQLGIQLSGVPNVLIQIASNPSSVTTQLNTIDAYIAAHNLNPVLMVAAAGQLAAAQAAGATLSNMDMAMGAMGYMLGGANTLHAGNWDMTGLGGSTAQTTSVNFLAPAVTQVASLPSGNPMKDFINQLNTYISNPSL
jgi:hypothetical protein